jgi:hypothetical protein
MPKHHEVEKLATGVIEYSIRNTPSTPPWTTFTGVLEARRDSVVGERIIAMDPKATLGLRNKTDDHYEPERTYVTYDPKEWVRGIWTAPTNWNEIPSY